MEVTNLDSDLAYSNYWKRKELLTGAVPRFPVRRWWEADGLCDIEQIYYEAVRDAPSLLDVGAGDLRVMRKLQRAGYRGEYHTQDIGGGRDYTYRSLGEVRRTYGAILCLDVIEHLPLRDGLAMLHRFLSLLTPGGVLVVQTANARSLPHPLSWDMTHIHCYNLEDLWAYCTCLDLDVQGYRVFLGAPPRGPLASLRFGIQSYLKSRLLGCDHANDIALIARKHGPKLV